MEKENIGCNCQIIYIFRFSSSLENTGKLYGVVSITQDFLKHIHKTQDIIKKNNFHSITESTKGLLFFLLEELPDELFELFSGFKTNKAIVPQEHFELLMSEVKEETIKSVTIHSFWLETMRDTFGWSVVLDGSPVIYDFMDFSTKECLEELANNTNAIEQKPLVFQKGMAYPFNLIEKYANETDWDLEEFGYNIIGESFIVLRKANDTVSFVMAFATTGTFIYECVYTEIK